MKELSIEEKAKAYDGNFKTYTELINRLENVKDAIKKQNYGIAMDILCKPYPEYQITASIELKESEDERIRKMLINAVEEIYNQECGYAFLNEEEGTKEKILAWLENQGEQKPADIIPQDFEKYVEHLLSLSDGEGHGSPAKLKEVCSELLRLAKLQQKPEWSEEDKRIYQIEDERIRQELISYFKPWHKHLCVRDIPVRNVMAWLEKQDKKEYALKSSKDEDVHKFMQYIEKEAKAYEFNLPNRGYDIYAFAKDILVWLEKQGK